MRRSLRSISVPDYESLALAYHKKDPKGKIAVRCTKPLLTQEDLAMAYSPGVAGPCREIAKNPDESFTYTTRGNLVGVISNGSAVLGLGAIGPYAAKPVMEGKGMLFKKFADIDVFDIELAQDDPDQLIEAICALEPTFGGINLEDIKAPECFYIEEKLRERMKIPVFHDDQHGTAIIASAAFLNALELTQRDIQKVRVVFSGAGAAAIACAGLLKNLGVLPENIILCDSTGVISTDRTDLNPYKKRFAVETSLKTMAEALRGADAFVGVSTADILTPDMIKGMAKNPIIFALANPDPEIRPELALQVRPDAIIATGRSDYPNQVNNVLGFPYIFRGALDTRATTINDAMKLAAVYAIAALAKESVPEEVVAVYKTSGTYHFGRDYLIPKPVDQRVLLKVAPAVAKAAMDSGVARVTLDLKEYEERMERLLGRGRQIIRGIRQAIRKNPSRPRIVLPAGHDPRVLRSAKEAYDGGDLDISILGKPDVIQKLGKELGLKSLEGIEIIDPLTDPRTEAYAQALYDWRKRKGISKSIASQLIWVQDYFAATMVRLGHAQGMVTGVTASYSSSIRPILETIGTSEGKVLAGVYLVIKDEKLYFFADCTVNIDPSAEKIADIAISTAALARQFTQEPIRIAMLSYSNFGASHHPFARKMARACEIVNKKDPTLICDGEMQADVALNPQIRNQEFGFSSLKDNANVLIFPDVTSANISHKLLTQMGDATSLGPILVGLEQPAYVMQHSASVKDIVNMIYVAAHHFNP
jgi:malate dehydrogenase (oxaloacetate-decarboxylating)(NADP+)